MFNPHSPRAATLVSGAPARHDLRPRLRWVAAASALCLTAGCGAESSDTPTAPDLPPPDLTGFAIGGDVSFLPQIEDNGGVYSDAEGEKELLTLLGDNGFNSIRLKLWHTPAEPYNTLERVLAMAARIEAAGMTFLLDFHYSDWWADPGNQTKPAAWDGLAFDALTDSVYQYTRDVVAALEAQGTTPEMVQIGNEISPGFLWPEGRVSGAFDTPEQWDRFVTLLDAGVRGTKDGAAGSADTDTGDPSIMIHFADGGSNSGARTFYQRLIDRDLDFDVIGVSYYPKWHGRLDGLAANLRDLGQRFERDLYVVETAYPWTLGWKDNLGNIYGAQQDLHVGFDATFSGQAAFLDAVRRTVQNVPNGRGKGVYYWAPEWIAVEGVPSAWENVALFDFNGRAVPGLNAFSGVN